ncbi:NlpC/P60 family protein [Streptomyces sp. NBS 14/10]|uniref:C40 family peptidase n=1 Tax=Streptomyces sp. NBS 14/10 TaxID=1945643 RepID=UPI00180F81E7|nr:C40 family peptidase [Streptomyces sp. NBS 14/10]KAK1180700.1 NlpC/P60 family protein [Streptomyces sp. NBS 14/10]NUS84679.1 LysM peptidoglycan-binding domain-containing protein [Streptomyces sp.]
MGEHIRAAERRTTSSSAAHAKPRAARRGPLVTVVRAAVRTAALAVLTVLAVLAGALLAVHGPDDRASAQSPAPSRQTTLAPPTEAKTPADAKTPAERPKEAKADRGADARPGTTRPAAPTTVVLVSGDTLYGLAEKNHTTVKKLQHLNKLGSSTLIYAGDTLNLPGTVAGDAVERPAPADDADDSGKKTDKTKAKKHAKKHVKKPTKKHPEQQHATGRAAKAAGYARAQLGKPYVWGGTGPRGYDCSGLIMRAWQAAGVKLPRTTWAQRYAGKATTRAELRPGDLVLSNGDGHVALYIGGGKVIHAPGTGLTVRLAPLPAPERVTGYRHIAS